MKQAVSLWMAFVFALAPAALGRAETAPPAAAPEAAKDATAGLSRVKELEKAGDLLGARALCDEILKSPGLSKKQSARVRRLSEALDMKLLFSPIPTPGSRIVEVAAGDSLYKIARKNGTTVDLVKAANGLKSDTIYPGMKLKVMNGRFSIRIDKSRNVLTLSLDGKPLKRYRVATGMNGGTPAGTFRIVNKLENPTWYKAGAVIPPGTPENFLGTRWLGFDSPGYGIHGTIEPASIGKQVSSGCIRMLNAEVEELYRIVPAGTQVTITD